MRLLTPRGIRRNGGLSSLGAGLLLDRGGELLQVRAEGIEEAHDRVPPDPTPSALDLRDVGGVDAEASRELVLGHVSLHPQRLERVPEYGLILASITH
jgi:hypothetical protein